MPKIKTAEQLLRAEAREQARLDLFVESLEQTALEDIDYLLHNEEGRDPEIFALIGADPEITIDEYELIPVEERDPNWVAGVSAMARACTLQVWASKQTEIINMLDKRSEKLGDVDLSRDELEIAALDGIKKTDISEEMESLTNGS